MAEVVAAMPAGGAGTIGLQRPAIAGMPGIAEADRPGEGVDERIAPAAGGEDAIKHVDPGADRLDDVGRLPHPHEIPGTIGREPGHGGSERRHHRLGALSDG